MKLNKKLMLIAAAGALGAASASPALAFENEFHGFYNLKYFISNYETGAPGFLGRTTQGLLSDKTNNSLSDPSLFSAKRKASNFFDSRARIFYTAKANDDLKLVTGFEIDSIFGDRAQGNGNRNVGGALEADSTNLETKWVYLDFKIPSTPVKVTAGIQPVKDAFKGIFLDADIAGINTVTTLGPATVSVGYFRGYDESFLSTATTTRGTNNLDIVAASVDYNVNKNLKVGMAYYLYSDNRNDLDAATSDIPLPLTIHVFGVNADAKIGKLGLSGFAAMQHGAAHSSKFTGLPTGHVTFNAFAANIAAKMPIGPGTARTAFLYASGDDGRDGIDTAWQSVVQTQPSINGTNVKYGAPTNTYNESNMMLLNRASNMEGTQADINLINSINNKDQGTIMATTGYDLTITPKAFASVNAGVAWAAKNNNRTRLGNNGTNFLGTEVNFETGYKLYDNLTAKIQAAYLFLGGYYSGITYDSTGKLHTGGRDPEDPYTARVMLSYVF